MIDTQFQDEVEDEHNDTPGAVLYEGLKGVPDMNIFLGLVGLGDPPQPHQKA